MLRKIEWFLIAIVVLLTLFKMMHWSLFSPVLIISFTVLAMFYAAMGFVLFNGMSKISGSAFSGISPWRIPMAILAGLSVSVIIFGILFKLFLWEDSETELIIGVTSITIWSCVSGIFLFRLKNKTFRSMFVRCVCWGIVGLFFLLLTNNAYIDFYYHNYPDYAHAFKNYVAYPHDSAAEKQWETEGSKLDSLYRVHHNYK